MGLSARTDDYDGNFLPEGYITISTSAGNRLYFRDNLNKQLYMELNKAQTSTPTSNTGGFNTENATG